MRHRFSLCIFGTAGCCAHSTWTCSCSCWSVSMGVICQLRAIFLNLPNFLPSQCTVAETSKTRIPREILMETNTLISKGCYSSSISPVNVATSHLLHCYLNCVCLWQMVWASTHSKVQVSGLYFIHVAGTSGASTCML